MSSALEGPVRGDSLLRPSPIMADARSMIRNANVSYELALSHGFGKPVVLGEPLAERERTM